jgi:hypothetical protein
MLLMAFLLLMKSEVNEAASSITGYSKRSYCPQNMGIISEEKREDALIQFQQLLKKKLKENLLQFIKMEEL